MISWVRRRVNVPVRRDSSAARSSPKTLSSFDERARDRELGFIWTSYIVIYLVIFIFSDFSPRMPTRRLDIGDRTQNLLVL